MVEAVALRACVQTIPGNAAKGAQLTDKNISDMVTMMELLGGAMINDLKNNKEDEEPTVFKLLNDSGLLVRMEDHNGETPLHKLARFTVPDDKIEMFTMVRAACAHCAARPPCGQLPTAQAVCACLVRRTTRATRRACAVPPLLSHHAAVRDHAAAALARAGAAQIFHKFIMKMRDECKEAKKSLGDSINKQDAKGKTVMCTQTRVRTATPHARSPPRRRQRVHENRRRCVARVPRPLLRAPAVQAIESKNIVLVQLLNTLGKDRPDSLIVTASGWSVLHQAVQTDHFETLKEVVAGLLADGGRLRVLINLKDKSGRQPLHIAAYRCEGTDIVEYLMENGANGRSTDASGLDPTHLAEKAGRRKSKEIIEEGVRKQPIGRGGRRMSKEVMEVLALNEPGGAVAPATATATPK